MAKGTESEKTFRLERDLEAACCRLAKAAGWYCRKLSGPGHRSMPDRMFIRRGIVLFIEFKRPGERPGPLQVYVIDLIRKQGFEVILVDNIIDGRKAIRRFVGDTDSS